MTTLVTGASGFVGSAVVRHLLEQGHKVRVMLRQSSDTCNIDGLDVERVYGDLLEQNSLITAIKGCRYLFHVAADYRLWVRRPRELYDANVTGTMNLMHAAMHEDISRIVYTSSVATLGINKDGTPASETTPVSIHNMIGHYKRSKYLAEQQVQQLIEEHQLPAVIVNPSTPIGPRDIKPTPTGRMVLDAACGRMPAYVDTGLNVVHVDDIATGHRLAFDRGEIGERYILGGHDMTLQQILQYIAKVTDKAAPKIKLPHNLVLPIAYFSQAWAWLSNGKEPRATVDGVRMSKKHMFFSSAKAQQQLGYQARPAEAALSAAIDWFLANNYCQKKI